MTETRENRSKQPPAVHPRSETAYEVAEPSIAIERPDINSRWGLVIVPQFPPSAPEAAIVRTPQGFRGRYRVTFKLAIPGKNAFHTNLDASALKGESLLVVPKGTIPLQVDISNGPEGSKFQFSWNDSYSLATAQITLDAANLDDAEAQAHELVSPLLSLWSFKYDVAIEFSGYEVFEERTSVRKIVFGLVGKAKLLDLGDSFEAPQVYRPLFSIYREALNATNVFYRVLCFYKVIEAVRRLRGKKAAGPKTSVSSERIPQNLNDLPFADPLVRKDFEQFLGWKFSKVIDHYRGLLRNAVAHLNPKEDCLDADSFEDVNKCERAVMVLKYVCREMLRSELSANPELAGWKIA